MGTDEDAVPGSLQADWDAILRSEAACLALDPEWRDAALAVAAFWAATWAAFSAPPAGNDGAPHPAGAGDRARWRCT